MVTDPIADSLTRIRNAQMVNKEYVDLLYSKVIEGIVQIMKENGFIKNYKVATEGKGSYIRVYLKYDATKRPIINEIRRVSKPGLRKYVGAKNIRPYKNGIGVRILTTSKGIITDRDAKKQNIGGEVICEIW
jgi:small subunit ribosomal protein S8